MERSIPTCSKGGIVSLVMNHAKAAELAKMISETNDNISAINMSSKFLQGAIGAGANAFKAEGAGDVIGLVISSGFAIYDNVKDVNESYSDKNMQYQQKYAYDSITKKQAKLDTDGGLWTKESTRDTGIGILLTTSDAAIPVIGSNREALKTIGRWGTEEVVNGNTVTHAFWRFFTVKTAKDMGKAISKDLFTKQNAQKFGIGILATLVSNGIEWGSNQYENNLYKEIINKINDARGENKEKINIKANYL